MFKKPMPPGKKAPDDKKGGKPNPFAAKAGKKAAPFPPKKK